MWNWIAKRISAAQDKAVCKAAEEGRDYVTERFISDLQIYKKESVLEGLRLNCETAFMPCKYMAGRREYSAFVKAGNERAKLILGFLSSAKEAE